jgi:hypothetical protein
MGKDLPRSTIELQKLGFRVQRQGLPAVEYEPPAPDRIRQSFDKLWISTSSEEKLFLRALQERGGADIGEDLVRLSIRDRFGQSGNEAFELVKNARWSLRNKGLIEWDPNVSPPAFSMSRQYRELLEEQLDGEST